MDSTKTVRSKAIIFAGVVTLVQAIIQLTASSLALAQLFCVIDFLRDYQELIFIKIIYFANPVICGTRFHIGGIVENLPSSAFVLLEEMPLTTYRTFIINISALAIAFLWFVSSVILMASVFETSLRWPWVITTVMVTACDVAATIFYINDTFYTQTLTEVMRYIGGTVSGLAGANVDTTWIAWIMALIYSRGVIFMVINVILVIFVIIKRHKEKMLSVSEHRRRSISLNELPREQDIEETNEEFTHEIPRAFLDKSYSQVKNFLLSKPNPRVTEVHSAISASTLPVSVIRTPSPEPKESHQKRSVFFPKSLMSLPQRLETIIAEDHKRHERSIRDTLNKELEQRLSQSQPNIPTTQDPNESEINYISRRRRRSTVAELQGQLPWSYLTAAPLSSTSRDNPTTHVEMPPVSQGDYSVKQKTFPAVVEKRREFFEKLSAKANRRYLLGQRSLSDGQISCLR